MKAVTKGVRQVRDEAVDGRSGGGTSRAYGVYARLAELGRAPARFREDLRSRMPHPEEAERLAIAPGTPVVEICRVALAADGTPVEVNEMTADSSAYIFR